MRNCDLVALALEADILMYPSPDALGPAAGADVGAAAGGGGHGAAGDSARYGAGEVQRSRDDVMMNVRGCN